MMIFVYTFVIVLVALVLMLGVGSLLGDESEGPVKASEGKATAAMCTTQLLESTDYSREFAEEDFVIEQDLVYTYDSINLNV